MVIFPFFSNRGISQSLSELRSAGLPVRMSGGVPAKPSSRELELTLFKFVEFLKVQLLGVRPKGEKLSLRSLRNAYNQKFKYAESDVSSSVLSSLHIKHIWSLY
jgi:hypothetical protein